MRRRKASQPDLGFVAPHKKFFCQVLEVFPVFLSSFARS
ncbi:protein of unassigned function [Methylobacterium oryzae CBMB20]|uniref:Protein of unassigned function n=1 Tax=Methylobacterium oryzae CBMB20 TaxID=693986 RepID=A0A089NZK2_9HYPH|nr:protein of unassigned function [Methylobacterium oryzae CBMB20]